MGKIILASASPRRRELLEQVGVRFTVCPAPGDEDARADRPDDLVTALARQKAERVWDSISRGTAPGSQGADGADGADDTRLATPGTGTDTRTSGADSVSDVLVIAADTVVARARGDAMDECAASEDAYARDMEVLGKPQDEEDAFRMLSSLAGCSHYVYTGVAVIAERVGEKRRESCFFERTRVFVREMSEREIRRYIATGEPMDKAGAYGIQGKFAIYIDKIEGDYNNVVGLPVASLYRTLMEMGIDWYEWQE